MKYRDYYQTLGVDRNASQDEIKRAYRKLARQYHPDVSKATDAEEKFKAVGEAYEVLKDPEKRSAYDQFGSHWKEGQGFTPPPDWDSGFEFTGSGFGAGGASQFSDFFESLFGAAGQRGHWQEQPFRQHGFSQRGQDHHAKITISLEESYSGSTREVELKTPTLDNQGRLINKPHTLKVKIPPGITAGQRIRLTGQGSAGSGGGEAGDLYLEIAFSPHPNFRAEGRDIHYELKVAPWEAALGATIQIPTLGGSIDLKIPANSQSGKVLRLKGKGLPGKTPGNQLVTLKVVLPPAESDVARELYSKMASELAFNPRGD
ncbi:MAG TPA: cytochrome C biogenesis protein [Gammaproteobacteria bacterium]|nr:cytochrome C biogenesis protein [Gammaproteobacteria bacterium]